MECGLPADIPNAQLFFVNATRGFQSLVQYQCDPGFRAVGRSTLMCDVDERWNGPPPRCDPIYCEEPASIRNGGFSLSTNSTVVGTVASYYCTSPRHVLVGVPKLTCRIDGSWDAALPECRLRDPEIGAPALVPNRPQKPIDGVIRRPVRKRPVPINDDGKAGLQFYVRHHWQVNLL